MKTGLVKHYTVPDETDDDTYDMETDAKGRSIMNLSLGKIGVFDPKSEQFTTYPTPTPGSGPRRGEVDAQGRAWMTLYWAGRWRVSIPRRTRSRSIRFLPATGVYAAVPVTVQPLGR